MNTALRLPGLLAPRTALRGQAPRGFILAYVMYALALLSVVTMATALMRNANDLSGQTAEQVEQVDSAIDTLTMAVLLCATEAPVGTTVGNVTTAFPLLPGAAPAPFATGTGNADTLLCPGHADASRRPMWTGRDGLFFPRPPVGFAPWQYAIAIGCVPERVTAVRVLLQGAGASTAPAVLRRVAARAPDQRAFDADTNTLTVTLASDPCPP